MGPSPRDRIRSRSPSPRREPRRGGGDGVAAAAVGHPDFASLVPCSRENMQLLRVSMDDLAELVGVESLLAEHHERGRRAGPPPSVLRHLLVRFKHGGYHYGHVARHKVLVSDGSDEEAATVVEVETGAEDALDIPINCISNTNSLDGEHWEACGAPELAELREGLQRRCRLLTLRQAAGAAWRLQAALEWLWRYSGEADKRRWLPRLLSDLRDAEEPADAAPLGGDPATVPSFISLSTDFPDVLSVAPPPPPQQQQQPPPQQPQQPEGTPAEQADNASTAALSNHNSRPAPAARAAAGAKQGRQAPAELDAGGALVEPGAKRKRPPISWQPQQRQPGDAPLMPGEASAAAAAAAATRAAKHRRSASAEAEEPAGRRSKQLKAAGGQPAPGPPAAKPERITVTVKGAAAGGGLPPGFDASSRAGRKSSRATSEAPAAAEPGALGGHPSSLPDGPAYFPGYTPPFPYDPPDFRGVYPHEYDPSEGPGFSPLPGYSPLDSPPHSLTYPYGPPLGEGYSPRAYNDPRPADLPHRLPNGPSDPRSGARGALPGYAAAGAPLADRPGAAATSRALLEGEEELHRELDPPAAAGTRITFRASSSILDPEHALAASPTTAQLTYPLADVQAAVAGWGRYEGRRGGDASPPRIRSAHPYDAERAEHERRQAQRGPSLLGSHAEDGGGHAAAGASPPSQGRVVSRDDGSMGGGGSPGGGRVVQLESRGRGRDRDRERPSGGGGSASRGLRPGRGAFWDPQWCWESDALDVLGRLRGDGGGVVVRQLHREHPLPASWDQSEVAFANYVFRRKQLFAVEPSRRGREHALVRPALGARAFLSYKRSLLRLLADRPPRVPLADAPRPVGLAGPLRDEARGSLAGFIGRYLQDEVALVKGPQETFLELKPFDVAALAPTTDGAPRFKARCKAAAAGERCTQKERCAFSHAPPRRWRD